MQANDEIRKATAACIPFFVSSVVQSLSFDRLVRYSRLYDTTYAVLVCSLPKRLRIMMLS